MKPGLGLGLLAHTITLELKKPRQENHELEVRLGYRARPCPQRNNTPEEERNYYYFLVIIIVKVVFKMYNVDWRDVQWARTLAVL